VYVPADDGGQNACGGGRVGGEDWLDGALTQRRILLFWAPLALQWVMMAIEGPFLAAVIARMGDPAFNLAAYGVAFAFAILVESPVIMLMSASTALVDDATSYRRLRSFTHALNAGSTALLLFVLVPPVYRFLMTTLLGLPEQVGSLVYGALWLLLPWPAAIGYRRFLHGVLIRSGRTRLVAYGTILRLAGMGGAALLLYHGTALPGAWVGAIALSAGVVTEAAAAHVMARGAVRELIAAGSREENGAPTAPGFREIARFYYPLALTSLIGLTTQPILTFLMGRAPSPVASLAVFPVVHALSFLFRATAFSFQEAAIALAGARFENVRPLARFAIMLGLASSGGLALVAFTPLSGVWFVRLSALPPELAAMAVQAARLVAPMPAIAVALGLQQALLVRGRVTRPITFATGLEVATITATFTVAGRFAGLTGVDAAMIAIVAGRLAGNLFLLPATRRVLRSRRQTGEKG
jgi:progressive ankylosis protein